MFNCLICKNLLPYYRIGNGIDASDEGFWLVHGIVRIHKLSVGINDVKQFLKNTRELVIFNVHSTPEKNQDKLVKLLINEFRPWLVKPGSKNWTTEMSEIWSREGMVSGQGRIIIHYYDQNMANEEYFFPTPDKTKSNTKQIQHPKWNDWGNKQKVCDNVEFLKEKVQAIVSNLFKFLF